MAVLLYFVAASIWQAMMVHSVAILQAEKMTTFAHSFWAIRDRILPTLGVTLLVTLIILLAGFAVFVIPVLVITLVPGVSGQAQALWFGYVVIFLFFVFGAFVMLSLLARYGIAVSACVIERLTVWGAMQRSVFLTKGRRPRVLGVLLLMMALSIVISVLFAAPFMVWANAAKDSLLPVALSNLSAFFSSSLIAPLSVIPLTLIYFDERVRKEASEADLP